MKDKLSTLKEFFVTLREAIIILVFLFLIFFPTAFKSQLSRIGFESFAMGGLSMNLKEQMKETAQTGTQVAELQQQISGLKTVIDSISTQSDNAEEKKNLNALAEKTQTIYSATKILDTKVKEQLSVQQRDAKKLKIEIAEEGWIYAGKLKENKAGWDFSVTPNIVERNIDFKEGDEITIADNVYLRADASALTHAKSRVIGVVKASEKVMYLSTDFSHAMGGGWFLWLKVKRVPNQSNAGQ